MSDKKYVSVVGDVCVDLIIPYGDFKKYLSDTERMKDPDIPRPKVYRRLGGTSGNTALIAAKLGTPVLIVSKASEESQGQFIQRELSKYGINTDYLIVSGPDTGCMVCVLDNDDRLMMVWNDSDVFPDYFDDLSIRDEVAEMSSVIHFAGVIVTADKPQEREMIRFARVAKAKGCKCTIDLNLRVESWGFSDARKRMFAELINQCDVVFGSGIDEFEPFTGIDSFPEAVKAFSEMYPEKIVVARDGANDVLVAQNGEYYSVPVKKVRVVNKVGAGDAFNAGFLKAFSEGKDIRTCVEQGIDIASTAISQIG